MNKKLLALMLIVVLALSAVAVFGADNSKGVAIVETSDGQRLPTFLDGRLNGFDIGAPLAVFYTYADTPQGAALDGIQLLAIDPVTGNGNDVITASLDDVQSLVTGNETSIDSAGYSLNYNREAGYFWVKTPANYEGKIYTFAWQNTVFPADAFMNQQPSAQPSQSAQATEDATQQPTTQPTAQPTVQPTASA